MAEEECGECGGARWLNNLLQSLHRKAQAAENLFVGKRDKAIEQ